MIDRVRGSRAQGSRGGRSIGRGLAGLALFATLLISLAVSACAGGGAQTATGGSSGSEVQRVPVDGGGSYNDVSVAGLREMLQDKDFPLVNVHIPYEGEIEGTDLFIPYDEVEAHLDKLPADRDARIVLYCRSGSMSATAARELVQRGYTDVWNLDGGMIAWRAAGHEILNKGG